MIKAIETSYKSYKFRSRLEARWAVFFDELGIKWQYEPEGFELPGGDRYLPDFFLPLAKGKWTARDKYPNAGYWIEVKGTQATAKEVDKLQKLCTMTRHHGYLVCGVPGEVSPMRINMDVKKPLTEKQEAAFKLLTSYLPDLSPVDDLYFSGFIDGCTPYDGSPDLLAAIAAAKSARFEFGQYGALA